MISESVKQSAHKALQSAIKSGEVVELDWCESCEGDDKKIYPVIVDYTKPTSVIWLCTTCFINWFSG